MGLNSLRLPGSRRSHCSECRLYWHPTNDTRLELPRRCQSFMWVGARHGSISRRVGVRVGLQLVWAARLGVGDPHTLQL
jgi:hypothetical protein